MSQYALPSVKHRQNMNSKTKLQLSTTVFRKSRLLCFYLSDLLSRFSLAPTSLSLLDLKLNKKKKKENSILTIFSLPSYHQINRGELMIFELRKQYLYFVFHHQTFHWMTGRQSCLEWRNIHWECNTLC
jgi:hypothetical protein